MNSRCRSLFAQICKCNFALAIFHECADMRGTASCRGIFSTAEPTDDHAVCIFPFRRYEVCGMILYAKSSLELIVNNRIGKVGIRPDGWPPSKPHHRRYHPVVHRPLCPPTIRWPSPSLRNASHLAPESARCRSAVRPSVSLSVQSVRPSVALDCPYLCTYVHVRVRAPFPWNINAYVYMRLHTWICINARPVLARTALPTYVLLRINA